MEQLWNADQGLLLADTVTRCHTFGARLRGLLGKSDLDPLAAYWIYPATSIHTFFMRMPIDAVFVNADLTVVKLVPNMTPFQCTWNAPKATGGVIEGKVGMIERAGLKVGTRLELRDA